MSTQGLPECWTSVLGMMSGTSLDGVDLAACSFLFRDGRWSYQIDAAVTIPYTNTWKERLRGLYNKDEHPAAGAHKEYGSYLGQLARDFIDDNKADIKLIASHGHTIFHQPEKAYTFQLGDGAALASAAGIQVVCDFRSRDVSLGGQGAPLVPVGDRLLFGDYTGCLNAGGFANISFDDNNRVRRAYDVCPVNIVFNHLARQAGQDYDRNGDMASSGSVCIPMLSAMEDLDYYLEPYPKSLGREWFESEFLPIIEKYDVSLNDKLRTVAEHAAARICQAIDNAFSSSNPNMPGSDSQVLVTGGGAKNTFLMKLIADRSNSKVIIPDDIVVDYKEALVFAFLGLLRLEGQINIYASVTGASKNSSSGSLFLP